MKKLLASLLLLTACQTVSNSSETEKPQAWLKLKDRQFQFQGQGAAPQTSKSFAAMLQAAENLQWDKVKVLAEQHLNQHPGNQEAMLLLSLAEAGLGQTQKAQLYAELVLKASPGHAFALNILGVLRRSAAQLPEDTRQALVYFQLAAQSAPQNPVAYLNSGYLNLDIGNFAEARGEFKLARSKCNDCLDALLGSALANQALAYYDASQADIEAILARDPANQTALLLRIAQDLYLRDEKEKSREMLTELLANASTGSEFQKEARVMLGRLEALAH